LPFRTLWFEGDALHLLDQRLLPGRVEIAVARSAKETAAAIRQMVVRGAPAIGCAAAYGLALSVRAGEPFEEASAALLAARPTAVNLRWALERLAATVPRTYQRLKEEADRVLEEDLAACKAIGRFGAALVPERLGILTHCNAGGLATAGYGTALGVVRAALAQGKACPVYADETRPWLQGARLTAWELMQDGIPVTLLADVAAASLLSSGRVGCVVVGADRIAQNGDTANKVGTYPLALAAHAASVPFYVAAPVSTLDLRAGSGADIPIEERSAEEVTHLQGQRVAAEGVQVFNPAFDVTPSRYISAIVTERGVAKAPYRDSLLELAAAGQAAGSRRSP
jgi:methylthioribose-1-phosphate isomerase